MTFYRSISFYIALGHQCCPPVAAEALARTYPPGALLGAGAHGSWFVSMGLYTGAAQEEMAGGSDDGLVDRGARRRGG